MSLRPEADPHIGQTLGGQYRIEALLGYGGMGRVYRGLQLSVNRPVAIKLIAGSLPHPPEWARRFRREAEATARLSHPNSVRLFDFGVTESQELFMVMELLDGTTLAQHLLAHAPLPLATALSVTRQVLLALCEAHALGITHRDIKPDNIFLAKAGADIVAKVMDFGIAGLARGSAKLSGKLTLPGDVIGTPAYMSPEQAQGNPVDGKSDVYSLGVVLYEMITGRPVFESNTAVTLLLAHVARVPERLSERGVRLPEHATLQALLDRMLAKDPALRPSAAEALDTVTEVSSRLGVAAATGSMRAAVSSQTAAMTTLSGSTARNRSELPVVGAGARGVQPLLPASAPHRAPGRPLIFALGAGVVLAAAAALALRSAPALRQVTEPSPLSAAPARPASQPQRTLNKITVRSRPSGASVYVDGEKLGVTPYELSFDRDTELSVAADGYVRRLVRVTGDTRSPLSVDLVAEAPRAAAEPRRPAAEPLKSPPKAAEERAQAARTASIEVAHAELDTAPVQAAEPAPSRHAPIFFSLKPTSQPRASTTSETASRPISAPDTPEPSAATAAPSSSETTRSAATRVEALREDELTDVALDDDEKAHVSAHHGLRVLGRALVQAVGRILIPYPDRARREALARMPLAYPSFREARAAYKREEIDGTGFQEAVWQLREQRRSKIQLERDRFARGELTQEQYEARLDRIWDAFWGRNQ